MKKKFEIEQIGIIHSPYKTKNECPIQGQVRNILTYHIILYFRPSRRNKIVSTNIFG
jgi:tRNA (Thr-GGU) A37 N-methylase